MRQINIQGMVAKYFVTSAVTRNGSQSGKTWKLILGKEHLS